MNNDLLKQAKQAVQANPRDAEAWQRLGTLLEVQGQTSQAEECYRRAQGLKPSSPSLLDQAQLLEMFHAVLGELKAIRSVLEHLHTNGQASHAAGAAAPHSEPPPVALLTEWEEVPAADSPPPGEALLAAYPPLSDAPMTPPHPVIAWLAVHDIVVKNHHESNDADEDFNQIATFLGERYNTLARLYAAIKRSLPNASSFTYNLSSKSQEEISNATQLCHLLYESTFLSTYRYNKESKIIHGVPQNLGKITNFFTGGWFERFVYQRICAYLATLEGVAFTCLLNPQISLPNGDDFELDMFFLIDGMPLWIECKTGDFQNYLTRYSNTRKSLSVPKERSFLIILELDDHRTNSLSHIYDVTLANQNNFLLKIQRALGQGSGVFAAPQGGELVRALETTQIASLLNKVLLRPCPEYRAQVITLLILLMASMEVPRTMAEIKDALADDLPAISRSQLQEVLNAIVRSGCMLDVSQEPVLSFSVPIFSIISEDPAIIEARCIQSYTLVILAKEPLFFEDPANVLRFERVVGGKAPAPEVIQALKRRLPS